MAYFQIVNFLIFGIFGKLAAPFYVINNVIVSIADKILNLVILLKFLYTRSKVVILALLARRNPEVAL